MAEHTMVNFQMIRRMVREFIPGQMGTAMQVDGVEEKGMARERWYVRMEFEEKITGNMELK